MIPTRVLLAPDLAKGVIDLREKVIFLQCANPASSKYHERLRSAPTVMKVFIPGWGKKIVSRCKQLFGSPHKEWINPEL